ncbi:MAG: hypothetical protein VB064_10305 [Oscillospiraceae bacterium]|nr:hypothetical protein [Oscillospiraceae bacterium]
MKKKFISVFAIILLISLYIAPEANAAVRASYYLSSYDAYIWSEGSGSMSVYFDVQGTGTMDEIGALSIRLQERPSGSSTWTTVKSYSHTDYNNMLSSNNDYYGSSVSYSGRAGYSYRAFITVWAGKNGSGDSREILTDTVVAKQ